MSQFINKIDFAEKYPELYAAEHKQLQIVEVPELSYLSVTGTGHPEVDENFDEAVKMLYGIAFTLKFSLKRNPPEGFFDYVMPPVEALWMDTSSKKKAEWKWKALLLQPSYIKEDMVIRAMEVAKSKHPDLVLPLVKFDTIKAMTAAQTLHMGSYRKEKTTVNFLTRTALKEGYELNGDHHEIFLNDPRRTPEDKLQTIIRYKVKKAK